jgi:hypothetical protein
MNKIFIAPILSGAASLGFYWFTKTVRLKNSRASSLKTCSVALQKADQSTLSLNPWTPKLNRVQETSSAQT